MSSETRENAGRIVIVTGGAGGVGGRVTQRWLETGARVLAADHREETLAKLREAYAAEPGAEPERLATVAVDLGTEEGAAAMVRAAEESFDGAPPDTLVHLVGGFGMGATDAPDAAALFERMLHLNLRTAFFAYRAMLTPLRKRGGGWIVGIGSRASASPSAEMGAYAASKAGLEAWTKALSAEVRGAGIHVNLVVATTIDTPANRRESGESAAAKWVRPDDVADATLFLCSDRARAAYGTTLEVFGLL
ncbi:MAG TPA: SDR family NAD(P)-dependent oxidoreductase [Armatimonadaceae bacterium]|nr:SDR family NAD(P)-dependent oxidoreductase [Armatimonadaceae bacterium]